MADQGSFTAGQVLTAAELNAFRQVTILQDTISVANTTNTTPSFSTEIVDVGNWHASGASTIVAPYDGVYTLIANLVNLNSTARGLVDIRNQTASVVIASTDVDDDTRDISVSVTALLDAGDEMGLNIYQDSGVTRSPVVTFSMELVRRV